MGTRRRAAGGRLQAGPSAPRARPAGICVRWPRPRASHHDTGHTARAAGVPTYMYGRMAATTVLPAAVLLVLACARGAGGSSVGPPCSPALARQLSRNFNRYARMSHTNASSLPAYLATHGVLVSQCMNPPSCVVPTPPGYHLSGSWISAVQAKDGGDITDLHAIHSAIGSVV
eukprot:SAG25_NODE_4696_length_766_cov_0.854573_1_plen_172_part_01